MNRFKAIGSTLVLVPALALLSTQARAEFKCDSPSRHFDRVACEKAKESPSALRLYIQRIQMIDEPLLFRTTSTMRKRLPGRRTMLAVVRRAKRPFNRPDSCKKIRARRRWSSLARQLDAAHFMRETLKIRSELRVFTLEKMGQPIEESVAL